jgi:hypothetical protein
MVSAMSATSFDALVEDGHGLGDLVQARIGITEDVQLGHTWFSVILEFGLGGLVRAGPRHFASVREIHFGICCVMWPKRDASKHGHRTMPVLAGLCSGGGQEIPVFRKSVSQPATGPPGAAPHGLERAADVQHFIYPHARASPRRYGRSGHRTGLAAPGHDRGHRAGAGAPVAGGVRLPQGIWQADPEALRAVAPPGVAARR